jgi:hypothetical protein
MSMNICIYNAGIIHPTSKERWLSDSGDRKVANIENQYGLTINDNIGFMAKILVCADENNSIV